MDLNAFFINKGNFKLYVKKPINFFNNKYFLHNELNRKIPV